MKSKRRHELKTNELADWLGRQIVRVKPHGRLLGYVAAALAAFLFLFVVLPAIRGEHSEDTGAMVAFNLACASGGTEPLREFLSVYPEAVPAPTARLMLADRLLYEVASGVAPVEGEDEEARRARLLAEARGLYARVAEAGGTQEPMARTGLALVAIQEGDLDGGRAVLEEVCEKWPRSVAVVRAKAHLEAIAGYEPVVFSQEPIEEAAEPQESAPESIEHPESTEPGE